MRAADNGGADSKTAEHEHSFWEHLEVLRWLILRSLLVVTGATIVVFSQKELLARIIFAPQQPDFVIYRAMCYLAQLVHMAALCPESFSVELINTRLAAPFFTHISASLCGGITLSIPIIVFLLWRFVKPALHSRERKFVRLVLPTFIFLFAAGVLLGYFLIFPLTFRFLGTYQFGGVVARVDLNSYMSMFYTILISMGLVFEMPMLSFALSRIGIISKGWLKKYRKYAVVIILIVAALITPTSDPFTLMLVSVPMYLLYMVSILVAKP